MTHNYVKIVNTDHINILDTNRPKERNRSNLSVNYIDSTKSVRNLSNAFLFLPYQHTSNKIDDNQSLILFPSARSDLIFTVQ